MLCHQGMNPLSGSGYAGQYFRFLCHMAPVAIYANVTPEFHKSSILQLSAPVAAAIFQGNITTWDDPAVLSLNPNLT